MRIAMVITAHNEKLLLNNSINYHSLVGVTDFYIYLDRLDLQQYLILRRSSNVRVTISSFDHVQKAGLQDEFPPYRYRSNHMVRQMAHVRLALEECRRRGIEWLINIDADELVARNGGTELDLAGILRKVPANVAAVRLPVFEVLPQRWRCREPLIELQNFKATSPFGEGGRSGLHAFLPQPLMDQVSRGLKAQGYDPFWDLLDGGLQDQHLPPLTAVAHEFGVQVIDWFLGHSLGKEIVRTSSNIRFRNLHATEAPDVCKSEADLSLLHYNCFSFADFVKKYAFNFRNHPDVYARGWKLDPLKRLFRDSCRLHGVNRLIDLYNIYCLYQDKKLREIEMHFPGAIVSTFNVHRLMAQAKRDRSIVLIDDS